jgi:hypothetical protein
VYEGKTWHTWEDPILGYRLADESFPQASVRAQLQAEEESLPCVAASSNNPEGVTETYNGERSPSLAADIEDDRYQPTFGNASHTLDWPDEYNSRSSEPTGVKQGQPIFSSSTTSLRHPRPRSSRTSLLLRSDSSEISGSIVAQVGKVKPVVPSSQAVDNEIWESWVGPMLDEQAQSQSSGLHGYTASITRISISPGASHVPISRPAHRRIPSEYTNESSSEGVRSSMQDDAELSQILASQHFSPSDEGQYEGESLSSEVDIDDGYRPSINHASTDIHEESGPNHVVKNTDQPVKATEESDPDSIWRKFVFGNSDDGVEADESYDRIPTALSVQRRLSQPSSILANQYRRNSIYSTISVRSPLSDLPSSRFQK